MASPRQRSLDRTESAAKLLCRSRILACAVSVCLTFFLAVRSARAGFPAPATDPIVLPVEVLGADGTVANRNFEVGAEQASRIRFLWLQINGISYAAQASVQVNDGSWTPINNDTARIAEPGKSFGGIGGGFSTLAMTLPVADRAITTGTNTIRFRFNKSDGLSSGFRVLAWNFLTAEGHKVLPSNSFAEDAPESWRPPLSDQASIEAGRELWHTSSLMASSLPNSPRILAHCADCHTRDGRDLKYFNFSNASIIRRSVFHGLSALQGEQIASYIRSLPFPNPGRPWNPPYQPGPGLDEQPISNWAAGAGLRWVLEQDVDALPYFFNPHRTEAVTSSSDRDEHTRDLSQLLGSITPDVFRPDGNLSARNIPIALQLPDWNEWLPRVHPKDAWGSAFDRSEFAAFYDGEAIPGIKSRSGTRRSLRALLAAPGTSDSSGRLVAPAFAEWSRARVTFLRDSFKSKNEGSVELTNKVYSTQLWQLVKTWEMMQEFSLEGRGQELIGADTDPRTWCSTIPKETAPVEAHIPDDARGVGGSALTNEYFNASWYELQILLNSGNHRHRDRAPVDWVYLVSRFHNLYDLTGRPEPARLLVAVTKALQSSDPHLGPEDHSRGWRPEQNIDPRITIDPDWAPMFQQLSPAVRRAITNSLLTAWMDKNLQYTLVEFLPLSGGAQQSYVPGSSYQGFSGGRVWESAQKFREAGVAPDLVERLQSWGAAYIDRAARLQYH
jgi:hypothetical protein